MYSAKRVFSILEYKKELFGILGFVATLFVAISLYSYNPMDPSWFYLSSNQLPVANYCGIVGAYVAATLFFFLGTAAYLMVPALLLLANWLNQDVDVKDEWERLLAGVVLVATIATIFSLHGVIIAHGTTSGGYVGHMLSAILYRFFDRIGSLVIVYAALVSALIVMFRFSFIYAIQWAVHGVVRAYAFVVEYQLIQKLYAGIKFVCWALVKPFIWLAQFGLKVIDSLGAEPEQESDDEYQDQRMHLSQSLFTPPVKLNDRADQEEATFDNYSADMQMPISAQQKIEDFELYDEPKKESEAIESKPYGLPSQDIFIGIKEKREDQEYKKDLEERARILEEKLERFGVYGQVVSIKSGPVVTLFEYQPDIDTKISKILALEDDLALALQALSIRILAPIPGRSVVGFEVSNKDRKDVMLAQIVQAPQYDQFGGSLPLILGKDTIGNEVVVDLAKMPHLLIAGSTGSGKSVALNTMLISLLCKCTPQELKLILIDPKRLEFAPYADIAHLLFPIVIDPKKSVPILRWVVRQMEERYETMAQYGARSIFDYNKMAAESGGEHFPFIVVVIDELSDLMLTVGREIEDVITRITQMARAAGIHMIVATQRPSVDVITGLIKVNFPSRISFRVTSRVDSRTILDCGGADKLLGRGDMLFLDSTASILRRIHGAFVSDREINMVVDHIKSQQPVEYLDVQQELSIQESDSSFEDEELYETVVSFLGEVEEVSISLLQRKFRIGYNRSARIIDMLESRGIIMPADGGKTRRVIR